VNTSAGVPFTSVSDCVFEAAARRVVSRGDLVVWRNDTRPDVAGKIPVCLQRVTDFGLVLDGLRHFSVITTEYGIGESPHLVRQHPSNQKSSVSISGGRLITWHADLPMFGRVAWEFCKRLARVLLLQRSGGTGPLLDGILGKPQPTLALGRDSITRVTQNPKDRHTR
jgi:hypothetical protein